MKTQVDSLIGMYAWDLVRPPAGAEVLPGRWVYIDKAGMAKARWVVCGNRETASWGASDVFAVVALLTALKTFLTYVVVTDLNLRQFNF